MLFGIPIVFQKVFVLIYIYAFVVFTDSLV